MKKALRRLTLHNFQSHEDTNLELSAGVNIIVGPSDVGKTSIIRGLRWLYYNQPRGSSFIRMGTSECWVEVETEDNIIVRRYRNDVSRKNGYLLVVPEQEPVVFEKHGASVPDEIKLALGVEDMVIDQDVVLNLNIAYQLEGAFLLETPGTTRAKAIGRLGDAHIVDAAQREIQKDLRAISQDIEKKKSQLSGEEQLLAKYSHLSSWANQLEKLNSLFAKHEKLVNLAKNLSDLQIRYDKNQLALNELLPVLNKLIGIEQMQSCLEQLQAAHLKEEKLNTLNRQFETKKNDRQIFVRILQVTSRLTVGQDLLARLFELSIAAKLYSELNQKLNDSRWRLQQAERIILTTTNLEVVEVKVATSHNKYRLVLAYDQLYRDYTNKNQRLKTAVQQLQGTCKLLPAEKSLDHLLRLRELGVLLNEKWRNYRQRSEQLKQVNLRIGLLSELEPTEEITIKIKEMERVIQVLNGYLQKSQHNSQAITQTDDCLANLRISYNRDINLYLQCLQSMGQCPVCHGSIDDKHLRELKTQLEEDWIDE